MNAQKKDQSGKKRLYIDPEPGDEKLTPMQLDWKYHVPFEGTLFDIRPDPDPDKLREMRRNNAMVGTHAGNRARIPKKSQMRLENRMGRVNSNRGILADVHKFIDNKLGLEKVGTTSPRFRYIESCQQLSGKQPAGFRGVDFVRGIFQGIEANWKGGNGSAKNFRWEPHPNLSVGKTGKGHTGAEVPFERALIILSELKHGYGLGSWTNQVPVASGLVLGAGGNGGKKRANPGVRAIDLIHRSCDGTSYDFIELKMPGEDSSETPLYAAIELLVYGLLYIFSRTHMRELEEMRKELKKNSNEGMLSNATKRVNLYVIAPEKFYDATDLSWLESELDEGLGEFLKADHSELDLQMHFRFENCAIEFLKEDPTSGHGLMLRFEPTPVYSR